MIKIVTEVYFKIYAIFCTEIQKNKVIKLLCFRKPEEKIIRIVNK